MKKIVAINIFLVFLFLFTMSGCEVIGGIFKAGVWTGIIIVVIVILLLLWIAKKLL